MSTASLEFPGIFVTGTDTGVGKTRVSLGLMEAFKSKGIRVCGMKPVATGCYLEKDEFRNEDAVSLRAHASVPVEYPLVNPYAFSLPVSPHIAAIQAGLEIRLDVIARCYRELSRRSEFVIVEGVGGWEVPLNSVERVSDLARTLGLPVLMVVGLRLGCLNHALLTSSAIRNSGCDLIGWVGNRIDRGFLCVAENMTILQSEIPASLLGYVPFEHNPDAKALAACFVLEDWILR